MKKQLLSLIALFVFINIILWVSFAFGNGTYHFSLWTDCSKVSFGWLEGIANVIGGMVFFSILHDHKFEL